eukprot:5061357-Prymnesium_polylepis.3
MPARASKGGRVAVTRERARFGGQAFRVEPEHLLDEALSRPSPKEAGHADRGDGSGVVLEKALGEELVLLPSDAALARRLWSKELRRSQAAHKSAREGASGPAAVAHSLRRAVGAETLHTVDRAALRAKVVIASVHSIQGAPAALALGSQSHVGRLLDDHVAAPRRSLVDTRGPMRPPSSGARARLACRNIARVAAVGGEPQRKVGIVRGEEGSEVLGGGQHVIIHHDEPAIGAPPGRVCVEDGWGGSVCRSTLRIAGVHDHFVQV